MQVERSALTRNWRRSSRKVQLRMKHKHRSKCEIIRVAWHDTLTPYFGERRVRIRSFECSFAFDLALWHTARGLIGLLLSENINLRDETMR
jgi:hypothetical protein